MTGEADTSLNRFLDKDGLVRGHDLDVVPHPKGEAAQAFRLRKGRKSELLYPTPVIRSVLDLLLRDQCLWEASRIRVLPTEWGEKRLPVFGPSFQTAVRVALSKGFIKSRFTLQHPERFDEIGLVADLVVHLGRLNEPGGVLTIQLEAWERLGDSGEVFYIHGLFGNNLDSFTHLDGAMILFSPGDLDRLVNEGRKLKGRAYSKQFRLDGQIPTEIGFEAVRSYLPVSELVDEYLDVRDVLPTPSNSALEPTAPRPGSRRRGSARIVSPTEKRR